MYDDDEWGCVKIRREEITFERLKRLAWFGVFDSVE
jgi:hypothetical protein